MEQDPKRQIDQIHALRRSGNLPEAVAQCGALVEREPANAEAVHLLGLLLRQTGKTEESIAWLRKSLSLEPLQERYRQNLIAVLMGAGRSTEAHAQAIESIRVHPDSGQAWGQLGGVCAAVGRDQKACQAFEKAVRLAPRLMAAHRGLGNSLLELGRASEAVEHFRKALELEPGAANLHSALLFAMQYSDGFSSQEKLDEARRYGRRFEGIAIEPHDNDRSPDRRLRVGYLSPDFRQHTIRHVIEPILEAHDRSQFEIFGYSSVRQPDAVTALLQKQCDHWRTITALDDDQAAQVIRQDRIDILVDLAGHMGDNRLPVLARKPAPIQLQIGYPATTGLSAMDYHIADPFCAPEGIESQFTEALLRLPDIGWMYKPCGEYPEIGPLPARANGYITFGCLNNPAKISDATVELWAKVLSALPSSKMMLLSSMPNDHLVARFAKSGIAADRLKLVSRRSRTDYLKLFHDIDMALDPTPYNGETTTCDGLWMGVPTIALAGDSMAGRRGAAILANVGLGGWVGESTDAYIEIAKRYADDLAPLQQIRSDLREQMRKSRLTDGARFTQSLEDAYREIWLKWRSQ